MRCVDCEYLKRIQKPIRFGKDIFDTGMVECTKHDLIMEYTSTRVLNKRTCVDEQTETQIKTQNSNLTFETDTPQTERSSE